jgi:hypothetical protein
MWATGRAVVRLMGVRIGAMSLVAAAALTGMGVGCTRAGAATAAPGWAIKAVAMPSVFSTQDDCVSSERCDEYAAVVTNVGALPSKGPVIVKDTLPETGVALFAYEGRDLTTKKAIPCTQAGLAVRCVDEEEMQPGASLVVEVRVLTEATGETRLEDRLDVEGGGAPVVASKTVANVANAAVTPEFGLAGVGLEVDGLDGQTELQAGAHPQTVTSSFDLTNVLAPGVSFGGYQSVEEPKDVTVELPLGLLGDPQATAEKCPEADLAAKPEVVSPGFGSSCPARSRIGTVVLNRPLLFESSQSQSGGSVSALYNMLPEKGYPAVFGFRFINAPVLLYTRVVPSPSGYRLRITAPNLPHAAGGYKVIGAILSFFGVPNARNEAAGEPATALFRNPTSCSSTPQELGVRVEVDSWVKPGRIVTGEAPAYPAISGCNLLQFDPTLEVTPEKTQADTPSGYEVSLKAPQPQLFGEPATPDLKNASVTLPEGVALSPSAVSGLEGCSEAQIDPLGTELGEGHPGGNASPYDDGLEHAAPGHCPQASKIGQVEIATPLLSEPLKGHIYVAQPLCGGEGQSPCTQASATNGDLYGVYLEAAGAGVILKLKGKVAADPRTGRLTASFLENPQLPFEELKMTFDQGRRAPLANPQMCGTTIATSELEPWSGAGSSATPTDSLTVVGCSNPLGFAPGFQAGVSVPVAGAQTPFAMTLTRNDGEQDFGGVEATLPPGLSGMVASVSRCEDAQANAGDCPQASRLGTAHVAAGAGAEPLWLEGSVYLTGPYRGAPFGLSIVIPTRAGPFDLGREVVRATIEVDPRTAQITTRTDPMPLIRDGIPLRLKTLAIAIDRPGFLFNPTNCARRQVSARVAGQLPDGTPGSTATVSAPFAVAGCAHLPFKPMFSVAAQAKHSKKNGVAMHVTVRSPRGDADIASVRVEVPKILPSRLSTLNLACTEAQFAVNPAGCPSSSFIGTATARTPILATPLSGPAIFVSHGGAAFPNLDLVLQGEGVTIVLVGDTFIDRKGVTSSTFATLPDLPVERFDLNLPSGAHSALSASGDLCAGSFVMPTIISAENGPRVSQRTRIAVNGCKPVVRVLRHFVRGPVATVVARLPSAGVMVATSRGLSRTVEHVRRPSTVTFKLRLSSSEQRFLARHPGRRPKALVRLSFKPRSGGAISTRITLLMG